MGSRQETGELRINKISRWTMIYSSDLEKLKKTTKLLLGIVLSFDVFFLMCAFLNLIWIPPSSTDAVYLRHLNPGFTLVIVAIFSTSLLCNSIASLGVSVGKRVLLIP